MATDLAQDVKSFLDGMRGLRCWHVSAGGCTLPSFSVALGEKIRRSRALVNPAASDEFRQFEPEVALYVWCSWRLDAPTGPVTSSNDVDEHICDGLRRLIGTKVRAASAVAPGQDLRVSFSNRLSLRVFCDQIDGHPSVDGNWELVHRDQCLEVGASSRVTITRR